MLSQEGIELIQNFEGFSATPYKDIAGVWTIGYGSTYGSDKKKITGEHKSVSHSEASQLMERDIKSIEKNIVNLVNVPITLSQHSALCSFVYNVGSGAFRRSTALKKLNQTDYQGCADEILKWKYVNKKIVSGLLRRRQEERKLFLSEEG